MTDAILSSFHPQFNKSIYVTALLCAKMVSREQRFLSLLSRTILSRSQLFPPLSPSSFFYSLTTNFIIKSI